MGDPSSQKSSRTPDPVGINFKARLLSLVESSAGIDCIVYTFKDLSADVASSALHGLLSATWPPERYVSALSALRHLVSSAYS